MPYNPGVNDISGSLRAQGTLALGQGIAEGFTAGSKAYNQNKMLTGQSTAKFEGAVNANPEITQFLESDKAPEAAGKAYARLHKQGAVGLQDAAVLAQFADSYTSQKQQQQENELRKQQASEFAQRITMQKKAEEDRAAQETKLRRLGQFSRGDYTGISPEEQAVMSQQLFGTNSPNDVEANDTGEPLGGNTALRDAVAFHDATGGIPTANTMATSDMRRDNAKLRADTQRATAQARTDAITAKNEAAAEVPTFHTDPKTGVTVVKHGNQIIPIHPAVEKNSVAAMIDEMVANGSMSHAEATQAKKDIAAKAGESSRYDKPMTIAEYMMAKLQAGPAGDKTMGSNYGEYRRMHAQQAGTYKPDAGAAPTFSPTPRAPAPAAPTPAAPASAPSPYRTPDDVRTAVRTGKLSREQGIAILTKQFGMGRPAPVAVTAPPPSPDEY